MAQNPLQQYFRQPKIYIGLPSEGIYNTPGMINGDPGHLPVYGMTGMDEIIMKTPDALLNGESTVKLIQSCCPAISDPWETSNLDVDILLTAIRIATFGNKLNLIKICEKCETENEYEIDLSRFIEHYSACKFDNEIVLDDFKILIRPLSYKQATDFSLRNFQLQQQLQQSVSVEDAQERQKITAYVFQEIAKLRNDVFSSGIESVTVGNKTVTEKPFIKEWIENVDRSVVDKIREHIEHNQETWTVPPTIVKCENCGHESEMRVNLDQSNFFVNA